MKRIELLDCTLRDGAYVVDAEFGAKTISGIIRNIQAANVDIIECGWLKDSPHKPGTTYYNVPNDLKQYMKTTKNKYATYVAMIDYNKYDCSQLTPYDGETIDAIRIVFPRNKVKEGIALVETIRNKGYGVYLQAANTPGYSDYEILELVEEVNKVKPDGLSIVDTFGTMYPEDLMRIVTLINNNLDKNIKLGFHAHNNQQLAFSLGMDFIEALMSTSERKLIVDSTLCGMGRGAGNTPTELISNYLNKLGNDYDMNIIMDTVDMYMSPLMESNTWGYSIPYSIAGMYGCHVNNVAYLTKIHRTRNKDMKIIFETLDKDARTKYDYDNLEKVYADYQNKVVDDTDLKSYLKENFSGKTILAILPGKSSIKEIEKIKKYTEMDDVIIVGINAILAEVKYNWLFFTNGVKYEYAKENYTELFAKTNKIISSNIKFSADEKEYIINYNDLQKRGWKYYDNSVIMFLRLMRILQLSDILIAGFDGYQNDNQYADDTLHPKLTQNEKKIMEEEIYDMLCDFNKASNSKVNIKFITKSPFESALSQYE